MWGVRILREVGLAIDQRYIRKVAAKPVPASELKLLLGLLSFLSWDKPFKTK